MTVSIIHSIMSTPQDAIDQNIEMWKVKKLIKGLEAARGYVLGFCHPILSQPNSPTHTYSVTALELSLPLSLKLSTPTPGTYFTASYHAYYLTRSKSHAVSLTPDSILSTTSDFYKQWNFHDLSHYPSW